ncbi:fimbrial chaperone protein [Variovorax boronicumulans]|uniref:fimbrial biogenesis chaperone n=1 Tax=Variovorax boronicumulans TaxID=436515 RepID=UPI002789752B|nr:fimbria/pilus periplasmic chaperone [Variovorax boronicumulans]MDP9990780.1 fimbrial chaperone protein [Variovorax boronicumulans]MDQ0002808.1 fimbrial chaperone protein [Variovorax boronicumulans]
MRRTFLLWSALLPCVLMPTGAPAASLSVAPLRIVLTPERPVASLTMGNSDETEEIAVQAEVLAWSQEDGRDVYQPTREVLVNPSIFRLPPGGGRQIVRLGLQVPAQADERSYRVFLRQLPRDQALPTDGAGAKLQTLLRIGVPIFVPPLQPRQALQWRLQAGGTGGGGRGYRLVLDNQGSEHIQLTQLVVRRDGGAELLRKSLSHYALAGQSAGIELELPALPPDTRLHIEAATDAPEPLSTVTATVLVPRAPAVPR